MATSVDERAVLRAAGEAGRLLRTVADPRRPGHGHPNRRPYAARRAHRRPPGRGQEEAGAGLQHLA